MEISLKIENLGAVRDVLDKLSGEQARGAYAKAITDTAFQVRREMQAELKRVFDRPTPYITSSPRVLMARPDKLSARIAPEYPTTYGIDPQKILQTQEHGGPRRDKRFEVILRRAGILPPGYQAAIPKIPFPGSDDGRGNIRGAFLVQLLSYLRTFEELGFSANMTAKRKKAIHKGTAKTAGRRYFVAGGLTTLVIEGGERAVLRTGSAGKTGHLPRGIWAATGASGAIRPVVMFVRTPNYQPRMSMERVSKAVDVQAYLDKRLRFRIREAAGV